MTTVRLDTGDTIKLSVDDCAGMKVLITWLYHHDGEDKMSDTPRDRRFAIWEEGEDDPPSFLDPNDSERISAWAENYNRSIQNAIDSVMSLFVTS